MRKLNRKEKEEIIKRVFWDTELDLNKWMTLLSKPVDLNKRENILFYARLLKSLPWYTLLRLFGENRLVEMLGDSVLNLLYPEGLRDKYQNARELLSQ